MDRMTLIALVALAALMAWPRSGMAAPIEYWTTHALDKLFPDSAKPADAPTTIALKLARNETEDAQVAVRTPIGVEVSQAAFTCTDLAGPGGAVLTKDHLDAWWVWYTYVLNNPKANLDPATCLRKAPGFFPDAFLESKTARIRDEWTQPLWVSVTAPKGTPPGEYTGTLGIDLQTDKGPEHIDVPLTVTVWPFTLPDEPHLHHTEWFSHGGLADYYRVELWSEAHWTWIGRVAADMAKHKQDTILTPFSALVDVTGTSPDTLTFTFTRLDRWVETFKNAGVTWIEGGHVGGREGGWESQIVWARFPILGVDTSAAAMTEEAFEPYMEAFVKAVSAHLTERGWGERYIQHIADEPIPVNEASWCHRAEKMREWLPGVPLIDAVMSEGLDGYIDWRVPQIQHLGPETKRNPNEQMWSYVCLYPQGEYPNRFLDYPSIRNRILFWLSWTLDLKGFLHWGYSHWQTWGGCPAPVDVSPWLDATGASVYCADRQPLPAGDPFIVYPGRNQICSSIRWETIRNGIEDFEYLYLLNQTVAEAKPDTDEFRLLQARVLLDKVRAEIAPNPKDHTRDDALLLDTRDRIGGLLAELIAERE